MDELLRENPPAAKPEAGDEGVRAGPRVPSLPGDVGFWTFIAADATLFALLFFQFSLDRSSHVSVFDEGQRALLVPLGAINTVVLVTSSWLLASAVRAAHHRKTQRATRLIAGTVLLGIVFAVLKVGEYQVELTSGHTVSSSSFFMYYFVITGIHLVHLMVGVIALVIIGLRVRRDTGSEQDRVILECGASYWHLIDLLWMFIFPLIYLAR
jgi:nitric oxide reductase NorE protein